MTRLVSDKEILVAIKEHQGENLTVRKLQQLLGYHSTQTVHKRLKILEDKGLIKRESVKHTVIEVVKDIY
jgi:uncharacterized membrane protein